MGKGEWWGSRVWEGRTRRPRYSHHSRVRVKGGGGDLVRVVFLERLFNGWQGFVEVRLQGAERREPVAGGDLKGVLGRGNL